MSFKHLGIVVLSYARFDFLRHTLHKIAAGVARVRDVYPDLRVTVIVADDHSPEPLAPLLAEVTAATGQPFEPLVAPARSGVNQSFNRGFLRCRELGVDVLCEIQDDITTTTDDWLLLELQTLADVLPANRVTFVSGFYGTRYRYDRGRTGVHGRNAVLRLYEGFVNLVATMAEWGKCFPMDSIIYRTGEPSGFPHNNRGSEIDFNLFFYHPQSLRARKKMVLSFTDLVRHIGGECSTWKAANQVKTQQTVLFEHGA